uniref:J domain-containing protein n=1 Tax=Trypanosoma congolense (strain IL3000) TaxID=1068625 RepID=G0UVN4_TRYCI|nr:conserved hypothetical protein [Trypanosoma congolense IL3000]
MSPKSAVCHSERDHTSDNTDRRPTHVKASIGRKALEHDKEFAAFVERMRAINYTFTRKTNRTNIEVIAPPVVYRSNSLSEREFTQNFEAESLWLDCCLCEFVSRMSRYKSAGSLIARIAMVLLVSLLLLWRYWPLWEVLIDVESASHYNVLGIPHGSEPRVIRQAYRESARRFHPDRNPNCELCRIQMIKIQQAYDILLAKGEKRFELRDRYTKELSQIRSLVFFRLYSTATNSAQSLYYLIEYFHRKTFSGAREGFSDKLRLFCQSLTMGIFTAYDILYGSEFSVVVLLQVFWFCVSAAKPSAQEWELIGMVKRSYVDFYKEAVFFLALSSFIHLFQVYQFEKTFRDLNLLELFFQHVLGVLYVLAHLYRMTPNLMDNFSLRKCSMPLRFLTLPEGRVSFLKFVVTEFGLLLDDLFAFTCRVPSAYRVVVFTVHVAFLCEFALFPWESSVLSTLSNNKKGEASEHHDDQKDSETIHGEEAKTVSERAVSSEEVLLLKNLDYERIGWIDIITTKYKKQIEIATNNFMQQHRGPVAFELVPTPNLQGIALVFVVQEDQKTPVNYGVLFHVKNKCYSRLLASLRAPLDCPLTDLSTVRNKDTRMISNVSDSDKYMTPSDLWKARYTVSTMQESWDAMMLMASIASLLLLICYSLQS